MPHADVTYVADRARAPYGVRPLAEVAAITEEVGQWLIDRGATCLVIACNTASAAALESTRARHPGTPVVGMEPAVKPAAARTTSGTVAVYATAVTFQGRLFSSVVDRFAAGVEVIARARPEWVEMVERGVVDGPEAEKLVSEGTAEAVEAKADQIVLACTHFSFLEPLIARLTGLAVVDPGPAVAAQVHRVTREVDGDGDGTTVLAASGDQAEFGELAHSLVGLDGAVIPFPS
jgi:glutamate racemase